MARSAPRPTLITVARLAGVSVASASRVLTGGTATPEMEQRVRTAAGQLGYVPDAAARSLRAGRTQQLAFAVADVGNPTYVAMMRGIESIARPSGYRLLVRSTGSDPADEVSLVHSLARRYVDGLIICPIRITHELLRALAAAAAPVVVVGNLPEGSLADNVRHRLGPRRPAAACSTCWPQGGARWAWSTGPLDTSARRPAAGRLRGGHRRPAGLPAGSSAAECAGDFTYRAGLAAARTLLSRFRPDAVMCGNDLLAFGVIRKLAELGLSVPGDVAVVGMDDTESAQMHLPSLTSVSLESATRGSLAVRLLLERLADPGLPPRRETVLPRLVIRESSQPRPQPQEGWEHRNDRCP